MNVDTHSKSISKGLVLARWGIIALAIVSFAMTGYGLFLMPEYATRHLTEFIPNDSWTYEQMQSGIVQLGWPINSMVWVQTGRSLLLFLGASFISLLILWRKSQDGFGLYLTFAFLVIGFGGGNLALPLIEKMPGFERVFNATGALGWQFFFLIFYFFPDGEPIPKWTRSVAMGWVGYMFLYVLNPEWVSNSLGWLGFPFVIGALGSQIFRYFWRADVVQRQQTRWIMATAVVMLISIGLVAPIAFVSPTGPQYGNALAWATIFQLFINVVFILFPVSITISILYYRLWDIDVIIRRTLQYTLVTGLLGLVYFGSIVLLQNTIFGNQQSEIAIVLSTLAIAALFNPLRRRIQDFIDRRFYRKKYNAKQALAEFAAIARDEVDMDKLTSALLGVVEETMQPERVTLWLKGSNLQAHKHRDSAGENTA